MNIQGIWPKWKSLNGKAFEPFSPGSRASLQCFVTNPGILWLTRGWMSTGGSSMWDWIICEAGDCLTMEKKKVTQNFSGQSGSGVQFLKPGVNCVFSAGGRAHSNPFLEIFGWLQGDGGGQGSIHDSLDLFKQLAACLVKAMSMPGAMLKLIHFGHISAALCCTSFGLVLPLCQMVQSLKSHFTYTEVICV